MTLYIVTVRPGETVLVTAGVVVLVSQSNSTTSITAGVSRGLSKHVLRSMKRLIEMPRERATQYWHRPPPDMRRAQRPPGRVDLAPLARSNC